MIRLVLALLLAVGVAGCAFGNRHINLLYAESSPTLAQNTKGRIAVARFSDAREAGAEKRVGILRNLYGMPTARITAEQDPVLWVSEGLVRALRNEGFSVEKIEQGKHARGIPTVTGRVTKVRTDGYTRLEVTVQADVSLELDGQRLLGPEECRGYVAAVSGSQSASNYQDVFAEAMDRFVSMCMPRIAKAMPGTR